jgi:hypothetical protein
MPVTINGSGQVIVQIQSVIKTDTFTTTAQNVWTDITALSATITPTSSSNKILVNYYLSYSQSDLNNRGAGFRVTRNGTAIGIANAAGSRIQQGSYAVSPQANEGCAVGTQTFIDTPSSTSALTYQIQLFNSYPYTACINRSGRFQDTNESSQGVWTSAITVMEISG